MAAPLPVEGEVVEASAKKAEKPISLWDYPATYSLMGVNIAVFLVMVWWGHLWRAGSGGNFVMTEFDTRTLLAFGASDAAQVIHGEWWRLLTAAFVHVTLLHIGLNMWCLWNLGVFGEPLLGRRGLICVYLLTGITGNLFSLGRAAFSGNDAMVAGASGAVFGIAGILIVLLSNRKLSLPWEELRGLRRQVIFFAVANLVLGMGSGFVAALPVARLHDVPRIDNSAHLGGLISGLALGLPLFPRMTSGKQSYRQRQSVTFVVAALMLCLIGYAIKAFSGN